jgi:hypothetical protein
MLARQDRSLVELEYDKSTEIAPGNLRYSLFRSWRRFRDNSIDRDGG